MNFAGKQKAYIRIPAIARSMYMFTNENTGAQLHFDRDEPEARIFRELSHMYIYKLCRRYIRDEKSGFVKDFGRLRNFKFAPSQ